MSWQEWKRRKVVQWALAYLAVAWVVLEAAGFVGSSFGWPGWVDRALIVLAAVGLPITVVLAWYHGEKGRQRVSGMELGLVTALLAAGGLGVYLVRADPVLEGSGALPDMPVLERSIAVLPLDNLSPAPEHAFFAEAMAEEITSALTQVPELVGEAYSAVSVSSEVEPQVWQLAPMAHVRFSLGDSAGGRALVERFRSILEAQALEDYEPEWRVFPRLQLAARSWKRWTGW